jgi:hypothetical protein
MGPKRLSLGDWIMGSFSRLPYTGGESQGLLSDKASTDGRSPSPWNRYYGSTPGESGQNTRRSLDSSVRKPLHRGREHNTSRRNSTSTSAAVAGLMQLQAKSPKPAPAQYESFREIARRR